MNRHQMLIHEYRIVLPLTVEEYAVAQPYALAEMSKQETGGGEGIEILKNENFDNIPLLNGKYSAGQYTHKIYHVHSKLPPLMKLILPKGAVKIFEESWNAYPYTKTVLTNPGYMKDGFQLTIESMHHGDRGKEDNILQLPPDRLKRREVTLIDIANDPVTNKDHHPHFDPRTYHSEKTGRGPLTEHWIETVDPVMTCYKLVTVNFKWFGLQRRVESFIQKFERRVFTVFHRQVFCSTDEWFGLTPEDIQVLEEETKEILDRERTSGEVRGTRTSLSSASSISLV